MKKLFKIIGIILLFIFLFFPFGVPLRIATLFENIIGVQLMSHCGGFVCFDMPVFAGWALVLFIYLIFFLIFLALRSWMRGKNLSITEKVVVFLLPVIIFSWGLSFFGDRFNFSPIRCAVVRDGGSFLMVFPNKSTCYYGLALGSKDRNPDEQYCNKIASPMLGKNDCYRRVSFLKRDPNLCNLILDDDGQKEMCIKDDGKFLDEIKCNNMIGSSYEKNLCYLNASIQERSGDLTICRLITDSRMKKDCYVQVLPFKGGEMAYKMRLCRELENEDLTADCEATLERSNEILQGCYRDFPNDKRGLEMCFGGVVEKARQNF